MARFWAILYIFLSITLFLPLNSVAANEPDPFAWEDNNVDQSADSLLMPGLTDASREDEETEANKEGVSAKVKEPTPTPPPESEKMFKEPVSIEEEAKTRKEINEDIRALFKEGKKYYDIQDYEGAIQIWERIMKNYPTARNIYDIRYALANAYEYNRQYDMAIRQYQKVLAEKPKHELSIEASYRLAGCYA